jgi:hypothetical protein
MIARLSFVLAIALLVTSCATVGRLTDPDYFKKQSSMQLCMDLLTSPSANVNRTARIEELSRRGENCSQYTGAAATQAQRDQQAMDALLNAQRAATPPPPPTPVTCYTRGALTTCQ